MLFQFLKYLQPTHYFQIPNSAGMSVFPVVETLPRQIKDQLQPDDEYTSNVSKAYDLSWQAIQKGCIPETDTYSTFEKLPLKDNYRFIRKNFNSVWVFYIFMLRLMSFHNPFKEISAWMATRNVQRQSLIPSLDHMNNWDTSKSELISNAPKVSVIIPTLNRYSYLNDVLLDFEKQDYSNFEIIVVDQSDNFNKDFYKNYKLDINVVRQEEKALWLARNTAIKHAKGSIIALSEDDVRIQPNWLSMHLKCLEVFNAEVSAGVFFPEGSSIPESRSFFALASQFATGNAMLYKSVFERVGLFDRQFEKQRMGDGEFGMRVYLKGIKSISNPLAYCVDVKAGTGGLREMGSWDAFRPSTFLSPRPIPSVVYFFRQYFGSGRTRLSLLRTIPLSVFPYQFKRNKPLLVIGTLLTIIIFPIIMYQVFRSWQLASKKIKEGPQIEYLV